VRSVPPCGTGDCQHYPSISGPGCVTKLCHRGWWPRQGRVKGEAATISHRTWRAALRRGQERPRCDSRYGTFSKTRRVL
jgi:hypothetical protein